MKHAFLSFLLPLLTIMPLSAQLIISQYYEGDNNDKYLEVKNLGNTTIDLAAEGQTLTAEELEHMYSLKTGALIHAAIVSPCLFREDDDDSVTATLDAFGRAVGIAFQIKDDILDVEGETHVIGKPSGSDEKLGKATYPGQFGIEASRARCDELLQSALADLEPFGQSAAPLEWLARYIVERGQ